MTIWSVGAVPERVLRSSVFLAGGIRANHWRMRRTQRTFAATFNRAGCLARPRALALATLATAVLLGATQAEGQDFPNVARTAGDLLAGPIAPEQGRTAIVAWHGGRIVSVPEGPGSQPGADLQMRVVDLGPLDTTGAAVTVVPAHTSGFHAHGYYKTGDYLFVGPHCLGEALDPCDGTYPHDVWGNAFRIGGPGTAIGTSELRRADIDGETGLLLGSVQRPGGQSPWGLNDFWTYGPIGDDIWLGVRRDGDWVYDWANGGDPIGPAIKATWDHLGLTGVTGFPFIMGNILIVASDQAGSGVATYDISDLSNPVLLDVLKDSSPGGYWPEIYGHYLFFPRRDGEGGVGSQAGFMVVDFEDPTNLQVVANRNLAGSNQYVTFQDEYAFMNRYKIDMRTFEVELELAPVPGLIDTSQFALPLGNLVVTGGYGTDGPGLAVWAHQAAPDTRGPFVAYHVPVPDQTNYPVELPITLSIPETLNTETIVDGVSLILRPVGGAPLATWHAFSQGKLLTVTPVAPLALNTTYELELTTGILDAANNPMEPYSFRFSTGSDLVGGNAAPAIASFTVDPVAPVPGDSVDFAWSGSDPEGDPVEYRLDFGDGSPRTAWSAGTATSHVYPDPGHYQVTVQVRDDNGGVAASSREITVVDLPADPGATASGPIALDSSTGRVFTVNPDNNTVSALDLASEALLWEAPAGAHPVALALGSDGSLWVACRDSDSVVILNASDGANLAEIPLDYGAAPVAIVATPGGATMLVSLEGDQTLARFDVASRALSGSLELGPYPRAIAVTADGTRAIVARFISGPYEGSLYDVDLTGAMALTGIIRLGRDHGLDGAASGRGVPNYLAGLRIDPDGQRVWVVGKKDNVTRGTFFAASMIPGQDSTVRAILLAVDLASGQEETTLRLDIDNSDSPSAIEFSPRGDYVFLTLQGNNQIAVVDLLDLLRQTSPGTVHSRWGTGLAPQGLVMDPLTNTIVTKDFLERRVTVFDADAFLTAGSLNVASVAIDTVAVEALDAQVLLGKRIFYNASDLRMSAEGYISCASCHLDGGHDGRTWDFTNRGEGFRNTTDLRGRAGTGHGNVHWSANFDEIQDFENDIRGFFGGSGFLSEGDFLATADTLGAPKAGLDADLDALAAYVSSLAATSLPRSPERNSDGSRTPSAEAGALIFADEGCESCHTAATDYTDRAMHDVGTLRASSGQRLGGPLTAIETPTLLGAHAGAPYFHDGSAATLEDVFTSTGGRLAQAEDAILGGGAMGQDIVWFPMKEWHQGAHVQMPGGETVTFDDVFSASAGDGYVEVRYAVQYGASTLRVEVNGGPATDVLLGATPNEPSYVPTEWRSVRVPVTYASGLNTFVFSRPVGGVLSIDDVLFSTPDDRAAADAHVRNLAPSDLADLVAYVASLDGQDASLPDEDCGGAEQPVCGSPLTLSRAQLKLGPTGRADKSSLKLRAELSEDLSGAQLLANLATLFEAEVSDDDASFGVALDIGGCELKGTGRVIVCVNPGDRTKAKWKRSSEVWQLSLKAPNLPDNLTGAFDADNNPVEGPITLRLVRGNVVHQGTLSDCRAKLPRKVTCRN